MFLRIAIPAIYCKLSLSTLGMQQTSNIQNLAKCGLLPSCFNFHSRAFRQLKLICTESYAFQNYLFLLFVGVFLVFFKHRKMSKIISTVCQFQQTKSMTKISAKIMTFWNFFNIPKPGVAFRVLLVVTSHYQSQCKKCVSFIFS